MAIADIYHTDSIIVDKLRGCGLCCLYRLRAVICEIEKMTTSSHVVDEKRSTILLFCSNTQI